MSAKLFTTFLLLGMLALSACSPSVVVDTPIPDAPVAETSIPEEVETEEIPDQPVPVLRYDQARDVVVQYLSGQYGLTLPAAWQSVDQTPENRVGSSMVKFVGDLWTVTVSAPVVAPEYLVYQIEASDLASGLFWVGTVDGYGNIAEESIIPPLRVKSVEDARDLVVKFVAEEQNLELPVEWTRQPDNTGAGSLIVTYTGGPWVVQVGFSPSAPFVGEYQVVIDHMQAVIRWQGIVDAHGYLVGDFVTGS